MAYNYSNEKPNLLTDEGQRLFLRIRDNVHKLLKAAGAVRMSEAWTGAGTADSWQMTACLDRMVELGEIREINQGPVAGQYRIFISRQ